MTITEFLLARIAEDEATAQHASANEHMLRSLRSIADTAAVQDGEIAHIVRWDPARVLAECEAKRRIIELGTCLACEVEYQPCDHRIDTLALLAVLHADHPDYHPEEWTT